MKKPQVLFIALLAMVVVVAGWWFLLYSPRRTQLAEVKTELAREQAQEQTLRALLKKREELKAMEPKLDLRYAQLSTWLPDQPNLPQFINDATSIAKESGIDFVSISPGLPTAGPAGQGVVTLGIQINGGFFQLLDYLVRLEKLPRSVVIDSVTIAPGPSATDPDSVGLTVQLQGRMFMGTVPQFTSVPPGAVAPTAPASAGDVTPSVPSVPQIPGSPTQTTKSAAPAPAGATAAPGQP